MSGASQSILAVVECVSVIHTHAPYIHLSLGRPASPSFGVDAGYGWLLRIYTNASRMCRISRVRKDNNCKYIYL